MGNDSPAIGRPSPPPTSLAPGFRFHPTDEELVQYYLKRKACGKPFHIQAVTEMDVYKSEPWELPGNASLKTRDLEWYFFSPVDRKYCNGSRLNRATGKGYWKATGKDRQVRHKDQLIGMKKTLVFHGGRAPDGKRTNWVMHEYRLTDEESERTGVPREKDAFVLCRIFEKSRLGPPNGDRYAPFIEEEWDNEAALVIPGQEAGDEMINGDDAQVEGNELEQETLAIEISNIPQEVSFVCKRERSDTPPRADPEPLPQNKRSKHDDPNSSRSEDYQLAEPEPLSLAQIYPAKHTDPNCSNTNGSEDSTTTPTAEDLCMSTMTAAAAATNKLPTPLLEFPLLEASRGNTSSNSPTFDATDLEKSVPPGYLKYISDLENGILNVSMERETLKIEVMRAQAMINILQSQIDLLHKENQDLRRGSRDV